MIAILNRVAHLFMQVFPGIGGMTPTSCAGFVWTQTLLANLRAISRRTACDIASRAQDALLAKMKRRLTSRLNFR